MAARRLIIVLVVLLGISTGIAIVAPAPEDEQEQSETAPPTGATGATGATGGSSVPRDTDLVEADVKGNDDGSESVKAGTRDRLVLTVDPGRGADIEIPGLGLAGTATEYAPVIFDVRLPDEPGNFPVVEGGGRELARIEVAGAD